MRAKDAGCLPRQGSTSLLHLRYSGVSSTPSRLPESRRNHLEALVTEEVLRALEPARLELHEQALADLERERQRLDKHWQKRLERARIEADRAARQYHAIEPENRLVARELERRWEKALREQRELEEQYDRFLAERPETRAPIDRRRIEALARTFPPCGSSSSTTIQDRQTIIRCLVERITVAVRGKTEVGRRDNPLGRRHGEPARMSSSGSKI